MGRAGKAHSKEWSDSYNVKDLDTGETKWIDLREYKKFQQVVENEEDLLGNFEDEDILSAKLKELDHWKENNVYENVKYGGQKLVTTRWVVTEKDVDGARICKARLVARGFEEQNEELTTDSPTCAPEILKITLAIMKSYGWKCKSLDVKTAYLQGEEIKRTVYLKPPREARTKDIWKLRKAVYGLKDAARVWYNSVINIIRGLGGFKSSLDPTIFYWKSQGKLIGIMCTHVDDFCYGGTHQFEQDIIMELKNKLRVGMEKVQTFRYIGVNIEDNKSCISLDQKEYIRGIKIPDIKRFRDPRDLNESEQTEYRALVGQLNWVTQQTRPDLGYNVSDRSKYCKKSDTKEMKKLIKIANKAKEQEWEIKLECLNGKLEIEVFADASFNNVGDGHSQMGYIISVKDKHGHRCPLFWKSRVAKRVAKSTLEAEALGVGEAAEAAIYLKKIWQEITMEQELPILIKTDSRTLERAVKSTSLVLSRRLRIDIAALREMIVEREIESLEWISSKDQVADGLTKEGVNMERIFKYITGKL